MLSNKQDSVTESFWVRLIGTPLSFSLALEACRKGYLITRPGLLQGAAKHIQYVPAERVDGGVIEQHFQINYKTPIAEETFTKRNIHGRIDFEKKPIESGWWVPIQEDMFNNEWQILGKVS